MRNRGYPFPRGIAFIFYKINLLVNLYYIVLKPILDDYLQNKIYFKSLSLIVFAKKSVQINTLCALYNRLEWQIQHRKTSWRVEVKLTQKEIDSQW